VSNIQRRNVGKSSAGSGVLVAGGYPAELFTKFATRIKVSNIQRRNVGKSSARPGVLAAGAYPAELFTKFATQSRAAVAEQSEEQAARRDEEDDGLVAEHLEQPGGTAPRMPERPGECPEEFPEVFFALGKVAYAQRAR
jgi:hypothetical protein